MLKPKLLSIEDEKGIQEALEFILSDHYEIEFADNGLEGIKRVVRMLPDLILLDLKMPDLDGFQVCKILREDREFDNIPIIIVSAFNDSSDRTKAFKLGADDYVTKPFNGPELIARIERKLQGRKSNNELIKISNFDLDPKTYKAKIDFQEIQLSGTEFRILELLFSNFGKLINREDLIKKVWQNQEVSPRLIDPHILSLRQKIQDSKYSIEAVYGKGYVLKKESN